PAEVSGGSSAASVLGILPQPGPVGPEGFSPRLDEVVPTVELEDLDRLLGSHVVRCPGPGGRDETERALEVELHEEEAVVLAGVQKGGRGAGRRGYDRGAAPAGDVLRLIVPGQQDEEAFAFAAVALTADVEVVLPDEHRLGVQV